MKQVLLAALALVSAAAAQTDIHVRDAWARFTVPGQQAGGVFMQLHNDGRTDALVGGSSPLAEKVEIHTHSMREGRMQMHEIEGGLPLAEGGRAELKPGGYHVMLIGLKQPLAGGLRFPLTLHFRHAPAKTVTVTVKTPAQEAAQPGGHGHHHHDHSH
nr:copper chaperone PCu(A)C [Neisseria shayeganii]